MAWAFKSAVERGSVVELVVEDKSAAVAETVTFTYPARAGQTKGQFEAMVKKEVRAMLDARNASGAGVDVSEVYKNL